MSAIPSFVLRPSSFVKCMEAAMPETNLSYDPFLWAVQDNPYPYYRRLREEAPVYHVAERRLWVVTRWDDCMEVLTNPQQWSSARGNFINDLPERLGATMATAAGSSAPPCTPGQGLRLLDS